MAAHSGIITQAAWAAGGAAAGGVFLGPLGALLGTMAGAYLFLAWPEIVDQLYPRVLCVGKDRSVLGVGNNAISDPTFENMVKQLSTYGYANILIIIYIINLLA